MGKPRLLLVDIETCPALVYTWKLFDVNIGLDQMIAPGRVICWGAKWLGEKEFHYADERAGKKKMFAGIHALMSEADALVSYNGDSFDLPKLDGAFLEHGLPPLPPTTSIDLYKAVKKLGYQSNKLAFIAPHLKIGDKVKNEGFSLWASCLDGDKQAWNRMRKYNEQDVRLLDGLYRVLRPYIRNHPYLASSADECPACQSRQTQHRGVRRTRAFLIHRIQCLACGSWFTGKKERCSLAA